MAEPEAPEPSTSLLVRAARGDVGAFDDLYFALAPALCVWVGHRMRATPRVGLEPEDVVQEVWHQALRSMPRFDPAKYSFRGWIFGIAKNTLLHALRHAGRRAPAAGGSTAHGMLAAVPELVTSLSKRVARADNVARLATLLEELSAEDRELAVLCGLEGVTAAAAGERLGLAAEAAAKRWQRLRARLRSHPGLAALVD